MDEMTIDPLLPVWFVVILLACLLGWSIGIEWRRPIRFQVMRLLACVVAILALAVILIRPSFPAQTDKQVILLTRSYSRAVADSLRLALPDARFCLLNAEDYPYATKISSYRQLFANKETERPGRLRGIVGQGLPTYALDSLREGFFYFASPLPEGITGLEIPRHLQRNKTAVIQGNFHNVHLPAWLRLSSPSGIIDSVQLRDEMGNFSFSVSPRASGKIIYSLSLTNGTETSITEKVPLVIDDFVPLNILILQNYPTFELSHLKNYLADRGHQVAVRSQLSRGIYRTEFANRPSVLLNSVTPALLDEFDLLIAEPAALTSSPTSERNAIERATHHGLGTLVVFNGAPLKFPSPELLPVRFTTLPADTVSVVLHGQRRTFPATRLNALNLKGTTLITDKSRILAGYTPVREGAAGFQLLRETYSLLLSGDSLSYGSVWSPLIEGIARKRVRGDDLQLTSPFPQRVDEPTSIEILSRTTPALFADSVGVPVSGDPLIDGLWRATIWPGEAGWHNLTRQRDTLSYYAFQPGEWEALRIATQQDATRRASKRASVEDPGSWVYQPLPLLAFWIAFMIACGFLWLAPKL